MACFFGADKSGNRFIACTRGYERRASVEPPTFNPLPSSPWVVDKNVEHKVYGRGQIVWRNEATIRIKFNKIDGEKTFIIGLIGKNIEVIE